jgi:hypothetical protein
MGVEREPVDLDYEAPVRPEEVDLESVHHRVAARPGYSTLPQQGQKPDLGVRASEGRFCRIMEERPEGGASPAPRMPEKHHLHSFKGDEVASQSPG